MKEHQQMAHSKLKKGTAPQSEVIAETKKNGQKFFCLSALFIFLMVYKTLECIKKVLAKLY